MLLTNKIKMLYLCNFVNKGKKHFMIVLNLSHQIALYNL
jgi:hypothetical protein